MTLRTILEIYFGINAFLAGGIWTQSKEEGDSIRRALFWTGFMFLFGVLILPYYVIEKAYSFLNGYFQINFWFVFYLTKKYHNLPVERLEKLTTSDSYRKTKSIRNKIYRHCTKLVFKRNNYKPSNHDNDNQTT